MSVVVTDSVVNGQEVSDSYIDTERNVLFPGSKDCSERDMLFPAPTAWSWRKQVFASF